jgi:hypothetical protein
MINVSRYPVSAADLDAVQFAPTANVRRLDEAVASTARGSVEIVPGVLGSAEWDYVLTVARAVEQRGGTGYNDHGIRYPVESELAPDEPPFEGVHVYNPVAETYVARDAFERLVVRWLRAVAVAAEGRKHPDADARDLAAAADRIEARLRDEGALS